MNALIPSLIAASAVALLGGCAVYPDGTPAYGYGGGYPGGGYETYDAPAYGYAAPPPVQSNVYLGFGGYSGQSYGDRYWGRGNNRGYGGNPNWNDHHGPSGGGPNGGGQNSGGPRGQPPQAANPGGNGGGWHGNPGGGSHGNPPPQQGGGAHGNGGGGNGGGGHGNGNPLSNGGPASGETRH